MLNFGSTAALCSEAAMVDVLAAQRPSDPPCSLAGMRKAGLTAGGQGTYQSRLRHALRFGLDIPVQPVFRMDDGQVALSLDEMESAYDRRRDHMAGAVKLFDWAKVRARLELATEVPRRGFFFWHDTAACPLDLTTGPAQEQSCLPRTCVEGMLSAARNSGLALFLLCYHPVRNLPGCVTYVDAEDVFPWRAFAGLGARVPIQGLADLVRCRALVRGWGGTEGGWFLDMDTLWFRRAPDLCSRLGPSHGHFFGSLQAVRSIRGRTRAECAKHWAVEYLRFPGDFAHVASPAACPPESPVFQEWLSKMEAWLTHDRSVKYLEPFQCLEQAIRSFGAESAVQAVHVVSSISRFSGERVVQAACPRSYFDEEKIEAALCVNNYWASSKGGDSKFAHTRGNAIVEPGSLWFDLLRRALPLSRKRCRSKRAPQGIVVLGRLVRIRERLCRLQDVGVGEAADGTVLLTDKRPRPLPPGASYPGASDPPPPPLPPPAPAVVTRDTGCSEREQSFKVNFKVVFGLKICCGCCVVS